MFLNSLWKADPAPAPGSSAPTQKDYGFWVSGLVYSTLRVLAG